MNNKTSLSIEPADDNDEVASRLLDDRTRALLASLVAALAPKLDALREARAALQAGLDRGHLPALAAPAGDWSCRASPDALADRRVELAAAPVADALEAASASRASTIVIDLARCLPGRGTALAAQRALPVALDAPERDRPHRPPIVFGLRALRQPEPALLAAGQPLPAGLVDLVLCLAGYGEPRAAGRGVHLRLAGIESADEAGLWAAAIDVVAGELGLDAGAVTVTIAVDTLAGAFDAADILRALHDRSTALAVDRPASLRSFLHAFRRNPRAILPDAAELTGNAHFQRSFGRHAIRLAHSRGALALAPEVVLPEGDSERERRRLTGALERAVRDGFDGIGVAEATLVADARQVFERLLPGGRQPRQGADDGARITAADLLQPPAGKITEAGIRANLELALAGFAATRAGELLLATGGRCRTAHEIGLAADQLWQWVRHETGVLDDGRIIDESLFRGLLEEREPARDAAEALSRHVLDDDGPGDFLAAAAGA